MNVLHERSRYCGTRIRLLGGLQVWWIKIFLREVTMDLNFQFWSVFHILRIVGGGAPSGRPVSLRRCTGRRPPERYCQVKL